MSGSFVPRPNDRILILRRPWLQMILTGDKTLEVRGSPIKAGRYWLGHKGIIHGVAILGSPIPIVSQEQWVEMRPQHCVDGAELPYRKTYALPILNARPTRPIPYVHPRGAIGLVKFRD